MSKDGEPLRSSRSRALAASRPPTPPLCIHWRYCSVVEEDSMHHFYVRAAIEAIRANMGSNYLVLMQA